MAGGGGVGWRGEGGSHPLDSVFGKAKMFKIVNGKRVITSIPKIFQTQGPFPLVNNDWYL